MNRIQVNITLKQADDVIVRELNNARYAAYAALDKEPSLKLLKSKMEVIQRRYNAIRSHLERVRVDPIKQKITEHRDEVKAAKDQMNWAITAAEKLEARKRVKVIIDRAGKLVKK